MAKIQIISPKLIIEKTLSFWKPKTASTSTESPTQEVTNETAPPPKTPTTAKSVESAPLTEDNLAEMNFAEPKRFSISLQEMRVISSALLHFQKYLAKKGEVSKAREVELIDRKLYEFIQATEKAKANN